jgi:hypothetical protein
MIVPCFICITGLHEVIVDLGWSVEETGNLVFTPPSRRDPVLKSMYGQAKQSYAGMYLFYKNRCFLD